MSASYEFYLTDDLGVRFGLLNRFAYASFSRSTRGYGIIQFGLPYEEYLVHAPELFHPDWRIEVWRSPAHGFAQRREGSFLLRKYRIYDQQDGVRMIEFFGRCPLDILRRWCVVSSVEADYKKTGTIDNLMKTFTTQEFITNAHCVPAGEFSVDGNTSLGPSVTVSYCGKNILDICKNLKETSFSLHNNLSTNRRIFFDVVEDSGSSRGFGYIFRTYADYRGIDRTKQLVFSIENGNLKTPEYYEDYLDQITVAQVNTQTVTGPDTLLSRWNSILDYKNSFKNDNNADIATANKMLSDGSKKVSFGAYFINTPGSPDQPQSLYGVDWDLGDLLRVHYAGMDINAEVEIVWISVNDQGAENIVGSNRVGE